MTPAKIEKNCKKTNQAIVVRPKNGGRLSFLVRKIFNTLLHHAQLQWDNGKGIDRRPTKDIFYIPAKILISDLDNKCKNIILLREYCTQMMTTIVEWQDPADYGLSWEASVLLASAKITADGGNSVVEWSYSAHLRERILVPEKSWTLLDLHLQNQFKGYAALALYEICKRYETNPNGKTNKKPPEWWYPVLTGNTGEGVITKSGWYRYFKRDYINAAIVEIEAVTTMKIKIIEEKNGRNIAQVQFQISFKNTDQEGQYERTPLVNVELLRRLGRFGFTRLESENFCGQYDENRLLSIVDIVEKRMTNTQMVPLFSPAAFFKSALRQGYTAAPVLVKKIAPAVAPVEDVEESARKAARAAARETARAYFKCMGEIDRVMLIAEFESEHEHDLSLSKKLRESGIKTKIVEVRFVDWLSKRGLEGGSNASQSGA